MTVTPSKHGASHSSGGNDPIGALGALTATTLNVSGATTLAATTTTTLGATAVTATTVDTTGAVTLTEQVAPAAPAADKGSLYLEDVAGVTTLRIKFANGQVIDICDDTP